MPAKKEKEKTGPGTSSQAMPICPRCDSARTAVLTHSPVKDAWVVYQCPVCLYVWRSTEPDYATDPKQYDPNFKIKPQDIPNFADVPAVPPLLVKPRKE